MHVLSDLKPYVCTFEDCELKLFSDRQTWFSHELKDHRKEWNCHFCAHSPFGTSTVYQAHLTSHHPQAFTMDQLPALFEMSERPLLKISPTDCPFCDDWEARLRAVNSHIPAGESLVVTPSQFQHHMGAHMVQLALFAIPRGYTEEGEADSANAAPQIDTDESSLGDDSPDLTNAQQLRKCEDILDELIEHARDLDHYKNMHQFRFPTFPITLPGLGTVEVSPVDFAKISQKLQTGAYSDSDAFRLELILFFALHNVCSRVSDFDGVESAFYRLWADLEGVDQPTDDLEVEISRAMRRIQWSLWRAGQFPPEPGADTRESCRLSILFQNGETVSRRFLRSANFEDVYAFVECYELIKYGFLLPEVDEPIVYEHEYNFKLREVAVGSALAHKDLDLHKGTIGYLMGNFAKLAVVGLREGEAPQKLFHAEERPLSPINEQILGVNSTTFIPAEIRVSASPNGEFAIPESLGASSVPLKQSNQGCEDSYLPAEYDKHFADASEDGNSVPALARSESRHRGQGGHSANGELHETLNPENEDANIRNFEEDILSVASGHRRFLGTLTVFVARARELPSEAAYKSQGPYCKVTLGESYRSTRIDPIGGGTPHWYGPGLYFWASECADII